ncbi:MAG: hypothetical protein GYA24_09235, partial [Candidatus Lokiarchaeota archaeon]|nr:hypothetical protein [Candidatus Lokiarchaeota archaeon]
MTSVPGHGMALSYYNKAMDLHSLVIDVNEEILATSEEKRAHVIGLQQKFLKDIDVALKRHSQVSFCRATVHFFPKASLLRGSTKTPVGQALFFPLKIQGDALTCALFTAGIEPLDHRRIIPTMEKIQSQLDEVRRVTLVRGINFVQQDAILQRHANRLMQHAEADYCEARWHQAKQPVMKSPAKMAIDVPPVPERPEWLKVATYHMPWHIDATNGQFIPRVDETTQEIEALEAAIEDEYLIQFHIVCPAIPIVPRLLETACTHLDKLWTELIPSFVPRWKHDLVQALIGRVVASMKTEEYSIKTTPGIMERDVLDLVIGLMKGYDEYASGLEGKFRDLKSQPVDANIFNAMLEGFKTVVGKSASIDLLADAIKTAHAASLASTISPGMESDPRVAEGTLLQVKLGIHGLKTTLVQSTVEALKQAMLGQVATKLDDLLIKKALQNEKGIVKEIGISIVKEASKTFFRRHVEQLAGEGGAGTPVLDPATYQADYKEALHSYLATFKIDIGQLIQLAAELLDQDQQDTIAPYMQKFIALKRDVVFLKEFVLKSNVLNK